MKPLSTATEIKLKRLVYWLEECVRIPFTKWRIGLDGLLGLLPAIGDTLMMFLSAIMLIQAVRQKVGRKIIFTMIKNVLIDYIIGLIPILGDLFDMQWKANKKNLALLLEQSKSSFSENKPD